MSIINSDGKNTNWQLNVLKGLEQNKLELAQVVATLNSITAMLAPTVKTATIERRSNSGTIPATVKSASIANVGSVDGTVNGITLKPGEIINFDAGVLNNTLAAINYNGTGTELLITYIL